MKYMETDLTSKLKLSEHIKNMKKMLKVVTDMDKTYFPTACIVHIINVIVPYMELLLSAYIIDAITAGTDFKVMISVVAGVTVSIFVLRYIASSVWNRIEVRAQEMYSRYSCIVEKKMLNMDFSRIDSPVVRELKDRIRKDQNWGAGLYSVFWQFNGILYTTFNLIGAVIVGAPIIGYLISSGRVEVLFILAVLIALVILCIKAKVYFRKKEEKYMYYTYTDEEKKEKFSCTWGFACEDGYNYKNGKDIRIYGGYDLIKRWTGDVLGSKGVRSELTDAAKGAAGNGFFESFIGGAVEGASYLMVVILAIAGSMSVGNIVRFAGCLKNVISGSINIMNGAAEFAMTSRKQMSTLEFFGLEDEMYKGKLPVEKRSDNEYQIEFKDVSFKYPGTEKYALRHFSMKLKIGEKLAIVGMNGSGKTTMIKLLCRLYDPDEGEILLNGVDIRKFKHDEYSKLFSVVFQDFKLMPFKLAENVAVDVNYDEEKVRKCLAEADFGDRVNELEKGINEYLYKDFDDNGIEISGGEAQKIAIARAIYKDAPFILLDEPTAALDPISEYEIYANFDKIAGSKTAIYISHRLSSCRFCQKIAVFHEGRLVQMGSHEELVREENGKYYEMWNAQAQYYRDKGIEMCGV